jgi:hypothetical protein
MELELYALALSASKKNSATRIEFGLKAWAVLAVSSEEATEKGLTLARERWPEADGWEAHSVSLSVVERQFLREALRDLDAADAEEVGGDAGAEEAIM